MAKKIFATLLAISLLATEIQTVFAKSTLELEAFDTVAGYTTVVEIEDALEYEDIEILVTKPNGSEIILETKSDEDGNAKAEIDGYHLKTAGTYEICARYTNLDEDYGQTDSFRVYEDSVSLNKSTLEADSVTKEATGYDPVELTIALKDKYGNPIKGHTMEVISSRNEDYITPYGFAVKVAEKMGLDSAMVCSTTFAEFSRTRDPRPQHCWLDTQKFRGVYGDGLIPTLDMGISEFVRQLADSPR